MSWVRLPNRWALPARPLSDPPFARDGGREAERLMDVLYRIGLFLPVILISVVAHEYAHARVAVSQGDPTPRRNGRLTPNPLAHLDLVGSFVVPLLLLVAPGGFVFGWARPVEVHPSNYRDERRGDILVSLAGVTANFLLAATFTLAAVLLLRFEPAAGGSAGGVVDPLLRVARIGIFFNFLLAVFNLLPVPPLDGSHVVRRLLPPAAARGYAALGRYSPLLLLAAFLFPELLDTLLYPVRWLTEGADHLILALS